MDNPPGLHRGLWVS